VRYGEVDRKRWKAHCWKPRLCYLYKHAGKNERRWGGKDDCIHDVARISIEHICSANHKSHKVVHENTLALQRDLWKMRSLDNSSFTFEPNQAKAMAKLRNNACPVWSSALFSQCFDRKRRNPAQCEVKV